MVGPTAEQLTKHRIMIFIAEEIAILWVVALWVGLSYMDIITRTCILLKMTVPVSV